MKTAMFTVIFNTYKNTCNIYVSYKANKVSTHNPTIQLRYPQSVPRHVCACCFCPTPVPCPFPVETHLELGIYHSFPF